MEGEAAAAAAKGQAQQAPATPKEAPAVDPEEAKRRFDLLLSVAEEDECMTEADMMNLVSKKSEFRLYDGFEPSGRMHIAQGIFKALNVNKCTDAGGTFVFWIADWFGLMNGKMGGDLEKIKVVGQYFVEVWKGAGMNLDHVEFRWASEDIVNNATEYWSQMLDIAKRFSIKRIQKCCQIMGRLENNLTAAQMLYPLMQCCDVFFLRTDICQLGLDQRKVNMLVREYCSSIGRKLQPVILSHHMLYGLSAGQAKMSKSNPDSAIFMEDTPEEVERKMDIAYCPREPPPETLAKTADQEAKGMKVLDRLMNPCLDYVKHIVMSQRDAVFTAGGKEYTSHEAVRDAFLSGDLSEQELKRGLAACINRLLQPVRDHFETNAHAKEVLAKVREYKREAMQPPKVFKRMAKLGAPGRDFCVVAPTPPMTVPWTVSTVASLKLALDRARALAAAQAEGAGGRPVLYLPDLGAQALGCFSAKKKLKSAEGIAAAFKLLLALLEGLGALEGVTVLWQSEVMLMDSSDYWISVIYVGCKFMLQEVQDALAPEEERVGAVVAALMHVGDVLALAPHTLISPALERLPELNALAARYVADAAEQEGAIPVPVLLDSPRLDAVMSEASAVTPVELSAVADYNAEAKKQIKQAFCEPGNALDSPILRLAEHLVLGAGETLTIKRHDGPVEYTDIATLAADVAAPKPDAPEGEFMIHPGDLKAAMFPKMQAYYASLATGVKAGQDHLKVVKKFLKK